MIANAPLVAVFVGTDHHRFDRLLGWIADIAAEGRFRFMVQHGYTPLPAGLEGAPMLGPAELDRLLQSASAVVTHAGPGSIMDARQAGHVPVVVARDPGHGEHVDGHQLRFLRRIGSTGWVMPANDPWSLTAAITAACRSGRMSEPMAQSGGGATVARFEALVQSVMRR